MANLLELERRDADLVLRWDDDSEQVLDYLTLRLWCPCAHCRPRREEEVRKSEFEAELRKLQNAKPHVDAVGGYGVRFTWTSGCSAGIYGFDYLGKVAAGEDPNA